MKKIFSLCLLMLISLFPGIAQAQNGSYERQAITQLTEEISSATS